MKKYLALLAAVMMLVCAGTAFATTIDAPGTVTVTAGQTATTTVSGTATHNGNRLTYSVSGLDWASISGRTITFFPERTLGAGIYSVTVTVVEVYSQGAGHPTSESDRAAATIRVVVNAAPAEEQTSTEDQETAPVQDETNTTEGIEDTLNNNTPDSENPGEIAELLNDQTNNENADAPDTVEPDDEEEEEKQIISNVQARVDTAQLSSRDEERYVAVTKFAAAVQSDEKTVADLQPDTETFNSMSAESKDNYTAALNDATVEETTDDDGNTITVNEQKATNVVSGLIAGGVVPKEQQAVWECMAQAYLTAADAYNEQAEAAGQAKREVNVADLIAQVSVLIDQLAGNLKAAEQTLAVGGTPVDNTKTSEVSSEEAATYPKTPNDLAKMIAANMARDAYRQQNPVSNVQVEFDVAAAVRAAAEAEGNYPIAIGSPIRTSEPVIATQKLDIAKALHGKPAEAAVLIIDRREGAVNAAAIDTTVNGSAVLLNSAGQETDHIPGYGEYDISKSTNTETMLIPGFVKMAAYIMPSFDYIPYIATPAASLAEVAEVTTVTDEVVVGQEVTTATVTVPVYSSAEAGFSTSFDASLKSYFKSEGYDVTIGRYILSGDAGVWSALAESGDAMLTAYSRALVRRLPKIKVFDDAYTSDNADYVLKVRYLIPKNTEKRIISGDKLLEFYPNGLTVLSGDNKYYPTAAGTAKFLDSTGRDELTDAMVMQIAAGNLGQEYDDTSMYYDGYIVMNLDKQADDAEPYKPAIVVKRAVIVSTTPGGDTPGGDTPGGDEPTDEPTTDPGSSGGGCSAGFSALALAVLGAFIAARKQ